MAPTEAGKDLAVEEKPEEVAPAVRDVDVVEGTNNEANDEDVRPCERLLTPS